MASNSIALFSRAKRPKGLFTSGIRACGIATPPPIPVDPNSSRLRISAVIFAASTLRTDAARRQRSSNNLVLFEAFRPREWRGLQFAREVSGIHKRVQE